MEHIRIRIIDEITIGDIKHKGTAVINLHTTATAAQIAAAIKAAKLKIEFAGK